MTATHEAMLWEVLDEGNLRVQYRLCAHRCVLAEGELGRCRVRQNRGGQMVTHTYDQVTAMTPDPIEKKPLFHVLPGSRSLSIATPGCNFHCDFCQNWHISQTPEGGLTPDAGEAITPTQIVELARRNHCASISYTYTEPTVFFELAYETAQLAKQAGLRNCFVSNGFFTEEALDLIAPTLDAINVDLKAFSDKTYRTRFGGKLSPVLDTLQRLIEAGIWVEVTTLVVPGMNDSEEELYQIATFIAGTLGVDVPWHVSRYHGDFKCRHAPNTPLESLERAVQIGRDAGLRYLYCGNVFGSPAQPGGDHESTHCPACQSPIVIRKGYAVEAIHLRHGLCRSCNEPIPGIWE